MAPLQGETPPSNPACSVPNGLPSFPQCNQEDGRSIMRVPRLNSITSPVTRGPARKLLPSGVSFLVPSPKSFARQQAEDASKRAKAACQQADDEVSRIVNKEISDYWCAHWMQHWRSRCASMNDRNIELMNEVQIQMGAINCLREDREKLESQLAGCREVVNELEGQRKELQDKAAEESQRFEHESRDRKESEDRVQEDIGNLNKRIESLAQAKNDVEKKLNDDLDAQKNQLDQETNCRLSTEHELKEANADIASLEAHIKMQKTGHEGLIRDANEATEARSAAVAERDKAKSDLDAERKRGKGLIERISALQADRDQRKIDLDNLKKQYIDLTNKLCGRQTDLENARSQLASAEQKHADVKDRAQRIEVELDREREQAKSLRGREEELQREIDASSTRMSALEKAMNNKDAELTQYKIWAKSAPDQLFDSIVSPKLDKGDSVSLNKSSLSLSPKKEGEQAGISSNLAKMENSRLRSIVTPKELAPPKTPASRIPEPTSSSPPPPPRLSSPQRVAPRISLSLKPKNSANTGSRQSIPMVQLPNACKKPGTEIRNALASKSLVPQKRKIVPNVETSVNKRRGRAYPIMPQARR